MFIKKVKKVPTIGPYRAVDPDPGGENLKKKNEKMQGKWKKIVIFIIKY